MTSAGHDEVEELRRRVADLERALADLRARGPRLAREITEREALLDEAERAAQMGTWVWDLGANTVSWSRQLFRILGYDPDRDVASVDAFFAAVHPEDRERLHAASRASATTGATSQFATRLLRRDGTVRDCIFDGTPIHDASGALVSLVGVALDYTERRRAERALLRSERALQQAQHIAHVGSWVYDAATNTLEWSEELFRIFGVDPATTPTFELFCSLIHPDDRARILAGVQHVAGIGVGLPVECRILRRSDGELRRVQMASQPLTDDAGALTGYVGTGFDITERRRLEEQLLHSQKLEAIGRLAGGVAHDFNNMLTAIFGNTELAVRQLAPSSPLHEHLKQIRAAADRAAALTRQLLAFARKQVIQPAVVDPHTLIRGLEPLLRPLVGEDVRLDIVPGHEISPIRIDPGQFEQLLINLAVNARDAMPDGGRLLIETANVTFSADDPRKCSELSPGDYVRIAVTDTGHGIEESIQQYVFEPFFTTKEVGKGSGLGLSTCHGIVKQHGGTIWFRSAPGEGTCFTICFPRSSLPLGEAEAVVPQPAVGGGETVLVVEDEAQVRDLCIGALRTFGYSVLAAGTGREAMSLAVGYPGAIHLLLSDVVLPDLRGPELAAAVRRARPALQILYASGYTEQGIHEPAVHFLQKPYTPTQLARAVRRVLDAGPLRRPPAAAELAAAGSMVERSP